MIRAKVKERMEAVRYAAAMVPRTHTRSPMTTPGTPFARSRMVSMAGCRREDATDEEIEDACRAAQAHDFIMGFPEGYETELEQGGVNVSGGQKQRLCIARALIKKPKVIIMDDSTSAVDVATDAKIRQALKVKLEGTTTIIIAQRITSVMDCDRIVVMNDGEIDGIGTHEELLSSNEIYREVYTSQQKGDA